MLSPEWSVEKVLSHNQSLELIPDGCDEFFMHLNFKTSVVCGSSREIKTGLFFFCFLFLSFRELPLFCILNKIDIFIIYHISLQAIQTCLRMLCLLPLGLELLSARRNKFYKFGMLKSYVLIYFSPWFVLVSTNTTEMILIFFSELFENGFSFGKFILTFMTYKWNLNCLDVLQTF